MHDDFSALLCLCLCAAGLLEESPDSIGPVSCWGEHLATRELQYPPFRCRFSNHGDPVLPELADRRKHLTSPAVLQQRVSAESMSVGQPQGVNVVWGWAVCVHTRGDAAGLPGRFVPLLVVPQPAQMVLTIQKKVILSCSFPKHKNKSDCKNATKTYI